MKQMNYLIFLTNLIQKNFVLLLAISLNSLTGYAQTAFKHTANSGNISGNWTRLDHTSVNNQPNALLFVTSDWGSNGPYHNKSIGVWYNSGRWTIFNQDRNTMTGTPRFNVMVETPGENAFIHTASAGTINGHLTTIDHPRLNNNPNARIMVTQNWGSSGPYNNNPFGVYYTGRAWAIYNQNFAAMPVNAKFNILISDRLFMVEATAPTSNWFTFSNPATDNQPGALVFVTQFWTSVYNAQEIGVWYTNNRWSVFNQSRSAMPRGAKFFVMVPVARNASPPSSNVCASVPRAVWFEPLRLGLSTATVRINNFTSRKHEYNSSGERAYHRPSDCFINMRMNGTPFRMPFNLDMVEGGPENRCKAYINDWNSNSTQVSIVNGRVLLRLNFESAGTELMTDCYNNGCCEGNPFCPAAGCPDYELNHAWIEIYLTPIIMNGRLSYASEVLFNVDVRELGNDPCTNNFWAFLCDWGVIPRVGDRQNRIRRSIEQNLADQLNNPSLRNAIEMALERAVQNAGIDRSRCSLVSIDGAGNLIFR